MKQQLVRSQEAVNAFLADGGHELADLGQELDQTKELLRLELDTVRELRAELRQRDEELVRVKAMLADRDRSLADANSRVTLREDEIHHLQVTHQSKAEQLVSQHQAALTMALEKQRKSMFEEYRQSTDRDRALTDKRLAKEAEKTRSVESALREWRDRCRVLESQAAALESRLAEKESALHEAQQQQRDLVSGLSRELAGHTNVVQEKLGGVSVATDQVRGVLTDLLNVIQEFRTLANKKTKKAPKKDESEQRS